MSWWSFLWIFFVLVIIIAIFESFHRRATRSRRQIPQHNEMDDRHVDIYTIHRARVLNNTFHPNQQQYSMNACNSSGSRAEDLPPKYEEIVNMQQFNSNGHRVGY